jgi:hypothetical protein
VAPAEKAGMVTAAMIVPTPGISFSALVIPIAVVVAALAGSSDPTRLAITDLPMLSENDTP